MKTMKLERNSQVHIVNVILMSLLRGNTTVLSIVSQSSHQQVTESSSPRIAGGRATSI